MKLGDLREEDCRRRIRAGNLMFKTGDFVVRLKSDLRLVADGVWLLYPDADMPDDPAYADFHVSVRAPSGLRRWFKRQVTFLHDEAQPFYPLPAAQALPMLEWGLNWCVSSHAHHFLVIHAAAVERNGGVLLMPAESGSGKSTLAAAMVHTGWRLISDELALVSPATVAVSALARPVSLKNESIDLIRRTFPEAVLSPPALDTHKGSVALMKAPADSTARVSETALPRWIIVPRYEAGASLHFEPRAKSQTYMDLARGGFNYSLLGRMGFQTLVRAVDRCSCHELVYSDLDEALRTLDDLSTGRL